MAKLSPHELRSIAVAAVVDPRSVKKALAGQPLHVLTMHRIRAALDRLGRLDLLPGHQPAPQQPANPPPQAA